MTKPVFKQPTGIVRSPDNRFEFNFDQNPSPQRASIAELQRHTEGLPVICRWCSTVFWPPMEVIEGVCSETCATDEQTYAREQAERRAFVDVLQTTEIPIEQIRQSLGRELLV